MSDLSKKLLQSQEEANDSPRVMMGDAHSPKTIIIGSPTSKPRKTPGKAPAKEEGEQHPDSYVLTEQPISGVVDFFNNFDSFEDKYNQLAGVFYVLIASFLLAVLFTVRDEVLSALPSIEVIFFVIIISLLVNYFLLNGALYKPFIDDDENSFNAKLCGGFGVIAIITFYYSMTYLAFHPAAFFLYLGLALIMWIEKFTSNVTYSPRELVLGGVAFIGVCFLISHNFSNQRMVSVETIVSSNITVTSNTTVPFNTTANLTSGNETYANATIPIVINTTNITTNTTTTSFQYSEEQHDVIIGSLLALAAGIFLALMLMVSHKLKQENKATISYIFTLFIALFLPVFFPLQGVIKPSLIELGFLGLCGLIGVLILLTMIRALQIERTGKIGVMLFSHLVFFYIIRIFFGHGIQFGGIIGCVLVAISTIFFSKEGRTVLLARQSFLEDDQRFRNMELKMFN